MPSPGRDRSLASVLSRLKIRWASASLHCTRDADRHLVDRAACEAIRAADRLRAEQNVHAEGAALTHQAIQQQRRFAGELVIFDEEFLELVHDQEDARQVRQLRMLGGILAVAGQIVDAGGAIDFAALAQFDVKSLQDAQAELALAFDGDDAGVRQRQAGVGLEFDAFLEVDEVKLDLVRAVEHGELRDEHVEQRRFARTGLACDEDVLRSALAQFEPLLALAPKRPIGTRMPSALSAVHQASRTRHDPLERDLDLARTHCFIADILQEFRAALRRRQFLQLQRERAEIGVFPEQISARPWRKREPIASRCKRFRDPPN